MILQTISHLKKYNYSNELKLHLVNFEKIDFHQVCVFPYNILVIVKEDDGTNASYISCKQTGEHHPLKGGNYYFIPTGMTVEYCLRLNISYYTFHVGLEINPGIDLFSVCGQITVGDASKWEPLIEEVYQEENEFLALCLIRKTLLDFFITHWPSTGPRIGFIPNEFRDLTLDIQAQVNATTTVGAMADRMNMTPEAFSRKFHRLIGVTPKAFIVKCLMDKIIADLCDSRKTIKDVARELNFSSEFYLSRFFKKSTGISPSSYRNMVRKP